MKFNNKLHREIYLDLLRLYSPLEWFYTVAIIYGEET